jgi:hypothetical protein
MITINVQANLYYQEQQVTLNGNTFYFVFKVNSAYTTNPWTLSILDVNKEPLLVGKRINPNQNLILQRHIRELLGGVLFCFNIKEDNATITKNNFGGDQQFRVIYVSESELDELAT